MSRSRIGSYEEGRSRPNLELLLAMSEFFHRSVDSLLKEDMGEKGRRGGMVG